MQARGQDAPTLRERAEREEAALLKRVRVYEEPSVGEYLTGVLRRLLGVRCRVVACPAPQDAGREPVLARIVVIADPTAAAFAMPGRRVFVHTGLLSRLQSEAQLALILARELAHDTARLGERSFERAIPRTVLSPTAAAVLGLDLKLIANAAITGYAADQERTADATALRWLAAAGYDPGDALHAFALLSREGGPLELFFYGNDLGTRERHEALREVTGQAPAARAGEEPEFPRRLRPVVRDNAALDIRAGRFALAQGQLDRALVLAPDDPIAHVHYGDMYRLQSQQASGRVRAEGEGEALERYQRAVALDPSYAEAFRQLALLHYQRRETAPARAAFTRYLSLKPDAPDAQRVREYLAGLRD